jgi:hypothetical protein
MVAKVEGQGPADGRYLVSSVKRSLLDRSGKLDATLSKPIPEKPEPASDTAQKSSDQTMDLSTGGKQDLRAAAEQSSSSRVSSTPEPPTASSRASRASWPSL